MFYEIINYLKVRLVQMKKIAISLLIVTVFISACKKEVIINCEEKLFSPVDQQVFQSGDTIKVEVGYDVWNLKKGDSIYLAVNSTSHKMYVPYDNANYTYEFIHTLNDSITEP